MARLTRRSLLKLLSTAATVLGVGRAPSASASTPPVEPPDAPSSSSSAPAFDGSRPLEIGSANGRHRFDTFVRVRGNELAYGECRAVAETLRTRGSFLLIQSGVGLGKTHLAHAIANHILDHHVALKIGCESAETFIREAIQARRRHTIDAFRSRHRDLDVFILDDVSFLAGTRCAQEELGLVLDSLRRSHRPVVLTSCALPEHAGLSGDLQERLEDVRIVAIEPPDFAGRIAMILGTAENLGIAVPFDVAVFLASRLEGSVRELEGTVARLSAHAAIAGEGIKLAGTEAVLQRLPPWRR